MFQCVCRWDRADNYRAEEQRKVKVETGKFCWSVTKTLCCQFLNGCQVDSLDCGQERLSLLGLWSV